MIPITTALVNNELKQKDEHEQQKINVVWHTDGLSKLIDESIVEIICGNANFQVKREGTMTKAVIKEVDSISLILKGI